MNSAIGGFLAGFAMGVVFILLICLGILFDTYTRGQDDDQRWD